MPETDAMVASNLTAVKTRENGGGTELMDQIHQEKVGVTYLGWFDSGVCYTSGRMMSRRLTPTEYSK